MINKFIDKVKVAGNIVEKKGKDITKVTQLKFKLNELSIKIEKEHIKIGSFYYNSVKSKVDNELEINNSIKNIDGYIDEIKSVKKQIDSITNTNICGVCGCSNDIDFKVCNKCGSDIS